LGYARPLAKPDNIEHGIRIDRAADRETLGAWRRIYFVPRAEVIVVLPTSNDQIVLHKFDLDAALEKSGIDYLFVTSQPPRFVKVGATFSYQLVVKVKKGRVTFRLDSGPKGMAISKEGIVSWAVPPNASEGDQDVILTVRDGAGQEVFHTFTIRVVK
jgi:hypothetical protein